MARVVQLFVVVAVLCDAQTVHKSFQVNSNQALELLKDPSVDIWRPRSLGLGRQVEATLTWETFMQLQKLGVVSKDLEMPPRHSVRSGGFFDSFQRYDAVTAHLQQLTSANSVSMETIGQSYEGREIFLVQIGASTATEALWIQCGAHGREWISVSFCSYLSEFLITERARNSSFLEHMQVFIVPVINPDGYEYTFSHDRYWRKNRRPLETAVGVDLNRNYGDHWGGEGAEHTEAFSTYCGPSAWSESETRAVRDAFNNKKDSVRILGGVDVHSYGQVRGAVIVLTVAQVFFLPYGWQIPSEGVPSNNAKVRLLCAHMSAAIKAVHGQVYTAEAAAENGPAPGAADDWLQANTALNIGLTLELRPVGGVGFRLPEDEIVPTCEEATQGILTMMSELQGERPTDWASSASATSTGLTVTILCLAATVFWGAM